MKYMQTFTSLMPEERPHDELGAKDQRYPCAQTGKEARYQEWNVVR